MILEARVTGMGGPLGYWLIQDGEETEISKLEWITIGGALERIKDKKLAKLYARAL